MLKPTSTSLGPFEEIKTPVSGYSLSDVRLAIPNRTTAIFTACLNGPAGAAVWARAWLSTEAGTLAEAASPQMTVGEEVRLEVILKTDQAPVNACMRIESAPLKTEHVVLLKL